MEGTKKRSDKHMKEWYRADPALDILASVEDFLHCFGFSDHLSWHIFTALHNRRVWWRPVHDLGLCQRKLVWRKGGN
ncbi:hypothetical protein WISP_28390 [Willisornis vidua]|uniref:Uncharacterized protein n=1 Tax=Willisornis vidua TaxID=1566151 RepID=A0ABQ9DQF7_9PASS|nr:hypothetical protein WISP_28390 [Willisornis vidua]